MNSLLDCLNNLLFRATNRAGSFPAAEVASRGKSICHPVRLPNEMPLPAGMAFLISQAREGHVAGHRVEDDEALIARHHVDKTVTTARAQHGRR